MLYLEFKDLRANSVGLDEVVHDEPPHQDLRCFINLAIFVSGT